MPTIAGMPVSEDTARANPDLVDGGKVTVSKYHNKRTTLDGMTFDSGAEAKRARELLLLHQAKKIFALAFQVAFPVAKDIIYVADFVYLDENLKPVIEDCKGVKTKEYKIKAKLFKEKYGLEITEC
ncbi:MAG: DUF1064 domain-containing protein [Patescibacteria group bacterium]|jgi:hypothetical protein